MFELVLQVVPVVLILLGGVWWVSALNSRVKSLEQRVDKAETNLSNLVEKFTEVHSTIIRMESKIDLALKNREQR